MNIDEYNEVINGQATYDGIANVLRSGNSMIIGWSDGKGTHFDILFTLKPSGVEGNLLQGGVKSRDLFVSIMRLGAFGFKVGTIADAYYYEEKLAGGRSLGSTSTDLATLINSLTVNLF